MIQKQETKCWALSAVAVVLLILVINLTSARFRTEFGAAATGISSSICDFIRRLRCGCGCSLSPVERDADDYQITTIDITFVRL